MTFDNVRVIGGCPGNANQDGMDWLGGGDTLVRDCFFRASDDVFTINGNWLGYTTQDLRTPGPDFTSHASFPLAVSFLLDYSPELARRQWRAFAVDTRRPREYHWHINLNDNDN